MKSLKGYGVIKMGKNKRLYQLLETQKALKKLIEKEIKEVDFHKSRVADLFVKLHDLNDIIEEMRGGR